MKISANIKSILFQKKLVASCSVNQKNNGSRPCLIYKLDPNEDKHYLYDLSDNPNWWASRFLYLLQSELDCLSFENKNDAYFSIYSMEDNKGECLALSEIIDCGDSYFLNLLETSPAHSSKSEKSELKYIGESFLSFLASLAKNNNKNNITLASIDTALEFYTKCHFSKQDEGKLLSIEKEDFDKLIKQNEKHCGNSVNIIA